MPPFQTPTPCDGLFTFIPFACFWIALMWLILRGEPGETERRWRTRIGWAFMIYGIVGILAWPIAYHAHFQFREMGPGYQNGSYPFIGWLPCLGTAIAGLQLRPGKAYLRGRFARTRKGD